MNLPELFGPAESLTFTVVEALESAPDAGFALTCAAAVPSGPVGIAVSLGLLNGQRVMHPAALHSIGAPTVALVRALATEWKQTLPSAVRVPSRPIPMLAQAIGRPVRSPSGLRFTTKDLKWEVGLFTLRCGLKVPKKAADDFDPKTAEVGLELELENSALTLRPTRATRENLLRYLTGELTAAT